MNGEGEIEMLFLMDTITAELTIPERDAILAGLRLLQLFNDHQLRFDGPHALDVEMIRDDSGHGLRGSEIDDLVDEINSL